MTDRQICDKCEGPISNGQCPCGVWFETNDQPIIVTLERAIYAYDHLCDQYNDESPLSMDHHSGNCAIFFKGDFVLCEKVKAFIREQAND